MESHYFPCRRDAEIEEDWQFRRGIRDWVAHRGRLFPGFGQEIAAPVFPGFSLERSCPTARKISVQPVVWEDLEWQGLEDLASSTHFEMREGPPDAKASMSECPPTCALLEDPGTTTPLTTRSLTSCSSRSDLDLDELAVTHGAPPEAHESPRFQGQSSILGPVRPRRLESAFCSSVQALHTLNVLKFFVWLVFGLAVLLRDCASGTVAKAEAGRQRSLLALVRRRGHLYAPRGRWRRAPFSTRMKNNKRSP